jgi:hypothetical protein
MSAHTPSLTLPALLIAALSLAGCPDPAPPKVSEEGGAASGGVAIVTAPDASPPDTPDMAPLPEDMSAPDMAPPPADRVRGGH